MERVQLVPNHQQQSSDDSAGRPSMDTLRPVFSSSRLQSRLEAASLVAPAVEELPSPPPIPARDARRPSPPYGSLFRNNNRTSPSPPPSASNDRPQLAGRASFDTFRPAPSAEPVGRASIDMLRRPNTALDNPREQAREEAGRRLAGTAPLHFTKSTSALRDPGGSPTAQSLDQRSSATLKLGLNMNAENVQLGLNMKKPLELSSKRDQQIYVPPRAPLLELPPSRQVHSSSGPTPSDRVIPLRSQSPPEPHHPHQNQFAVLPDLPPAPSAPLPAVPVQQQPQPLQQQQQQQQQAAPARKATQMTVNGKQYLRSALLGKGGSSRVYRVTDREHNVFALKRVELGKGDLETYNSFCNEIELLKRLRGHDRIIQLVDAEVNEAKRTLIMVCLSSFFF